jgi:K+-sensing histidine kinase KdpD
MGNVEDPLLVSSPTCRLWPRGTLVRWVVESVDRFQKGEASPGSGLGLTISRDLVEAQGGDLSMVSTPGAGTTVMVELPYRDSTGGP